MADTETTPDYGDPSEWDDEFPAGLAAELAEALRGYGWNVTGHHDGGVEIRLPGGHETGVWLAGGGRLWTGLVEGDGTCRNPTQVIADPADPGNVAFNADPLLKLIAARAAKLPALAPEDDETAYETDPEPQPRHGGHGTCAVCGGEIEYYESTAGNGDVLDSWWSHLNHPDDGHDAQLGGPA